MKTSAISLSILCICAALFVIPTASSAPPTSPWLSDLNIILKFGEGGGTMGGFVFTRIPRSDQPDTNGIFQYFTFGPIPDAIGLSYQERSHSWDPSNLFWAYIPHPNANLTLQTGAEFDVNYGPYSIFTTMDTSRNASSGKEIWPYLTIDGGNLNLVQRPYPAGDFDLNFNLYQPYSENSQLTYDRKHSPIILGMGFSKPVLDANFAGEQKTILVVLVYSPGDSPEDLDIVVRSKIIKHNKNIQTIINTIQGWRTEIGLKRARNVAFLDGKYQIHYEEIILRSPAPLPQERLIIESYAYNRNRYASYRAPYLPFGATDVQ